MAREFSAGFYRSKQWKKCRSGYIASVNGMCERCLKDGKYIPGWIVHHKKHITPKNINDTEVTLNWKNLEYLCLACHNDEHITKYSVTVKGLMFNANGELIQS